MPKILPPESSDEKSPELPSSKGLAESAARFTAWFQRLSPKSKSAFVGISAAPFVGYLLWAFNEFTSLRGWIHVLTSRFVLASMWFAGTVVLLIVVWGLRIRKWPWILGGLSLLLALALVGLDRVAPKPSPSPMPTQDGRFALHARAAFINFAPTTEGTIWWMSYEASGVKWRVPVATLVYVSIANKQNTSSLINKLSVEAKTESCDWFDLLSIDPRAGTFSAAMSDSLRRTIVVDLDENSLSRALRNHPIAPNESAEGWMIFDTTKECRTFIGQTVQMRLTVTDADGKTFTGIDSKVLTPDVLHPQNNDIQKPELRVKGESLDISSYRLQRYADRKALVVLPTQTPSPTLVAKPLANSIHLSQEYIPSDLNEWEFKKLITIWTDQTIENPNFNVLCDSPCSYSKTDMGTSAVYSTDKLINDKAFEVGIRQSFTARTPLTVVVYGHNKFTARVERIY